MGPAYLLIAIYLPFNSIVPLPQTQLYPSKETCQGAQSVYMSSQVSGTKWTICKKLNAEQQEYANVHGTALP